MHQKVLKINIRPSYNSENTVFSFNEICSEKDVGIDLHNLDDYVL